MPTSVPSASDEAALQAFENKFAQARQLILGGKIAAARAINDSILEQFPHHPGALIQRSRLESAGDHYRVARQHAMAASGTDIREKWQCLALLRSMRTFNLSQELRDLALRLPQDLAHDSEIAVLVARQFNLINDPHSALEFASAAAAHNPESAGLQDSIGIALLNLDRYEEAETHFRECLRLQPGHASAWWQLSRLRKHEADSRHLVDDLRHELARTDNPRPFALLSFALHQELDRLGDHAEAARALEQACLSMRKTMSYSADEDERLFAAIKSLPTDDGRRDIGADDAPFTPVFIVGMHCSGTAALEQLLARHGGVCPGGELRDFGSQLRFASDHHCSATLDLQIIQASNEFDYAAIGDGYLNSIDWRRSGERFLTDRLPSNFLNIGFILRALPNAKILHVSRDPMEACFSILREPFPGNTCRYSYDQTELGGYYRQYFKLMQHWRHRFPGRIHDVTKTALDTDPAAEMKRIATYLGMGFDPTALDDEPGLQGANTTGALQRQTRKNPNLSLQPDWEPYREYLTPLSWRLADVGQRH